MNKRRGAEAWRRHGGGGGAKSGGGAQRDNGRAIAAAWMLRWVKRGGGAQRNGRGLQLQRRNQSAAVAHSTTAAARWELRGGCGGFTGTVREWANASDFERHRLADVRVFVLG